MTATRRWLVDKSALRPHVASFADILVPRIAAGRVTRVITAVAAETRAREIEAALVARVSTVRLRSRT